MPKYTEIWDINKVLKLFCDMHDNELLDFKSLSAKLVTLLMMLGINRKNAFAAYSIDNISFEPHKCIIFPNKVLKHSRPGFKQQPSIFHRFQSNKKLCIVECLVVYLKCRFKLVTVDVKELIVTHGKPHRAAPKDTISRWIKNTLQQTGINH